MPEIPTNEQQRLAPALVAMGMRAISARTFAYVSLLLTAGVFGYVIYDPTVLKLVGAGMWALFTIIYASIKGDSK